MKTNTKKSIKTDKYIIDVETAYTNGDEFDGNDARPAGNTLTIKITIPYEQRIAFDLPHDCGKCPAGWCASNNQNHPGCGRNIPWTNKDYKNRPLTCRLQKADILDIISKNM